MEALKKFIVDRWNNRSLLVPAGILAAIVIVGVGSCFRTGNGTPEASEQAVGLAENELSWAHSESVGRLNPQFRAVDELFAGARVREFAENCLGWRSKWLLLKDKVLGSAEHAALIDAYFRESIFDHADLERLLAQCIRAYVQEIESVDNDFLVRLAADWEALPAGSVPGFDRESLRGTYDETVRRAIAASKSDVTAFLQRETVSFIVSEVCSVALLRLGVSSGILATGAASGWATFGLSLAVGLVVDLGVQELTDPAGKLAADLTGRLEQLRTAILFGDQDSPGVIPRLQQFAAERDAIRRDAIQQYMSQSGT